MIKLRDSKGNLIPTPSNPLFIEICDKAGNPAMIFYQPNENVVSQINKGSQDFDNYLRKHDLHSSKVIDLKKHHEDVFEESGYSQ